MDLSTICWNGIIYGFATASISSNFHIPLRSVVLYVTINRLFSSQIFPTHTDLTSLGIQIQFMMNIANVVTYFARTVCYFWFELLCDEARSFWFLSGVLGYSSQYASVTKVWFAVWSKVLIIANW